MRVRNRKLILIFVSKGIFFFQLGVVINISHGRVNCEVSLIREIWNTLYVARCSSGGIVPVISASRRSRRARRCNAVPATGTRDYTNQYFLHISRVFPNWPAAHYHSTPPCRVFTIVCPGEGGERAVSRSNLEDARRFSSSLPLLFLFFSNKNTFQLSSTLFLRAKKRGMAGEKTCYPPG